MLCSGLSYTVSVLFFIRNRGLWYSFQGPRNLFTEFCCPFLSGHKHTQTHIHTCMHVHTHACTQVHMHTHMHIHTCTFTYPCIHSHMHTHVHIHAHMHTHTHTRTHMSAQPPWLENHSSRILFVFKSHHGCLEAERTRWAEGLGTRPG